MFPLLVSNLLVPMIKLIRVKRAYSAVIQAWGEVAIPCFMQPSRSPITMPPQSRQALKLIHCVHNFEHNILE
jgi:hypothetical protein